MNVRGLLVSKLKSKIKRRAGASILLVALFLTTPFILHAQNRGANRRMSFQATTLYDVWTVETLRGEVLRVDRMEMEGKETVGIHVQLRTNKETVVVRLGPDWFIDDQPMSIRIGDVLEVKGSRVTLRGASAILAAEVRRGRDRILLRDNTGKPLWRGQRND